VVCASWAALTLMILVVDALSHAVHREGLSSPQNTVLRLGRRSLSSVNALQCAASSYAQ
jgi:hypothetical protein